MTRGLALFVPLVLAGALARASAPPPAAGTAVPQLKAISTRVTGTGASIVIEASEPAAYVATRPEPLTVYVDFRNVGAAGVANRFARNVKSPVAAVAIETANALGEPVSRVRITLAQAVPHRVRADRNTIVVDFDKPAGDVVYVQPPVSRDRPDAMAALAPADAPRSAAARASGVDPLTVLGLSSASGAAAREVTPAAAPASAATAVAQLAPPPAAQAPAPVQTAPAPAGQISPSQQPERRFTGNPISLDFEGADLRAVLRTFAGVSGLNMVIDPAVQGTVDVSLRDVPWDQALDIILKANKLGYVVDGTIVRIAPLTVLSEESAQVRKLAEEKALSGELRVLTKSLSYAQARDLEGLLKQSALSPRGTVQVDPRTNTLIITDLADRLQTATDLINALDRAQPQVDIEARIVNTNKNYSRALGVQWGFNGRVDPTLGNTTPLAFPNNGAIGGRTGASQGGTGNAAGAQPTAVNLAAPNASSAVGLALGSINGAFNLDVALSALETSGNGRILSSPRVTTQNNVEAEVAQGVKIPVQTTSNNTTTTTFIDAALTLRVTPQITAAGTVIMKIAVDNGSIGEATPDGRLSINTQRANTTVLVADGQTTVIGGIFSAVNNATSDRTPGLGSIPLLKWLFKRDTMNERNTELLIFITPRIAK